MPIFKGRGLAGKAAIALSKRLAEKVGYSAFRPDGTLRSLADNLVSRASLEQLGADLYDDNHVRRLSLPQSPRVLTLNCFAPWINNPVPMTLAGESGYTAIRLNARCPTGTRGTPPHLAMIALSGDRVAAAVMPGIDYLSMRRPTVASAYQVIKTEELPQIQRWLKILPALAENPRMFRYLDASALVKHALGLSRTFPGRKATLHYIYWQPRNPGEYAPFVHHRGEIEHFKERVEGDDLTFHAATLQELWESWESPDNAVWVHDHIAELRQRYDVDL